jgi:hypothetical protein
VVHTQPGNPSKAEDRNEQRKERSNKEGRRKEGTSDVE